MKKILAAVALAGLSVTTCYADGFGIRDITDALGQVNKAMGGNSRPQAQYVPPGTLVKLDNGRSAQIYGYECAPREVQPCGSIKVDNSTHRILVMPDNGETPFEERWSFKKLQNGKLVFRRPKGGFVTAIE